MLFRSTDFINTNPSVAYLYAGSFLEFALKNSQEPQKLLQKIISTGSLFKSFEKEYFSQLKNNFIDKLQKPLPAYALKWAKDNFIGESILTKNCLQDNKKITKYNNKDTKSLYYALKKDNKKI